MYMSILFHCMFKVQNISMILQLEMYIRPIPMIRLFIPSNSITYCFHNVDT